MGETTSTSMIWRVLVTVASLVLACEPATPEPSGGAHRTESGDVVLEYDGPLYVYHDVRRSVTCWVTPKSSYAGGAIACLADEWTYRGVPQLGDAGADR